MEPIAEKVTLDRFTLKTKADFLEHYTTALRWSLAYLEGKNPEVMGPGWQKRGITKTKDFPTNKNYNIGLIHCSSGTATLDIDHPNSNMALAAVGVDLGAILIDAPYKIVGDPMNPPKPIFRLPEGVALATKQLKWPDPTGKLNNNGTPALITVFELRGGVGAFQDVLPPSIHPDTKTVYTWLDGKIPQKLEDIPLVPAELLSLWKNWDALEAKMKAACPWLKKPDLQPKSETKSNTKTDAEFDVKIIQKAFNAKYKVTDILSRNDYEEVGKKWLCPNSSSGNPGLIVLEDGQKIKSYHGSDALGDGHPHDAYDCYVILEHDGDRSKAWHAAKDELGITFSPPKNDTSHGENGTGTNGTGEPLPKQIDMETGEVLNESESILPTYTVRSGQIVYNCPVHSKGVIIGYTPMTVADFTAEITQEITAEDGSRFFQVEGQTRQGYPFSFEIPTDDFSSDLKLKSALVQYAGAKAPVMANMSKHLSPAIQRFTNGRLKQIRRYDRTGWADGKFLIPGREPDEVTIHLPRKLPYAIDPAADLQKGLTALDRLIHAAPFEKSTVALSFIFSASLAGPAGWKESDRAALFLSGQTGKYKTSFAQCAMCLYGPGFLKDDSLIRFGDGATKNAMQKYATQAYDLPILIDNYKPSVSPGESGFYSLLHAMVEGGEKDRLNRESELRDSKPIYAWPIFTGEDTPDKDPASLARILKIDWIGGDSQKLTGAQQLAAHLCAVGGAWLTWLESDTGKEAAHRAASEFPAIRGRWAELLAEQNKDAQNIMRVASNLAINELTWQVMCHPDSPVGAIARSYDLPEHHKVGLRDVALAMANETAASVEAIRFLSALQELLRIKPYGGGTPDGYTPLSVGDAHIGWQSHNDEFYLKPAQARKAADDLLGRQGLGEVSNNKLFAQLDTLGLIASKGSDGKSTQNRRINGEQGRVLHLKKEAFLDD